MTSILTKVIVNDFLLNDKNFTDGLILKSDLNDIKKLIDLNHKKRGDYTNLDFFLSTKEPLPNFSFINVDSTVTINEFDSQKLFSKSRGKTKIIFHNEVQDTLNYIEFYVFIGFMRLVTIDC